jgi:uncharacterized membrane protein YeaQ/YmgE (transglycosylase-associated protein family)
VTQAAEPVGTEKGGALGAPAGGRLPLFGTLPTGCQGVVRFDFGSLFVAIVGTVFVLLVYGLIVGSRGR